jgi:serine/threonine protein kinase
VNRMQSLEPTDDPFPTPQVDLVNDSTPPGETIDLERTAKTAAVVIPGYELLEMIGQGGFGQVFKARQFKLDRLVALKLITSGANTSSEVATQFQAEALTLAQLTHPNIVPVYDFGHSSHHMFLAMELLEGEDLAKRISSSGFLDEFQTWHIIRQAAAGLEHAAARSIIHRDVKPSNLYLNNTSTGSTLQPGIPNVKLVDFGLAIARHDTIDGNNQQDSARMAVGTPAFMAPEQQFGVHVDLRADIYALGATAYQMLTGRLPFVGSKPRNLIVQKRRLPEALPKPLSESWEIIQLMMAPDPRNRIQTYSELISRIDQLSIIQLGSNRHVAPVAPRRRYRWVVSLSLALLLLIGSAATWYVMKPSPVVAPPKNYIVAETQEALFDGASLDRWATSGVWSVAADDDGTAVLAGTGTIRRTFANHVDYRLTLGVNIGEGTTTEIQFALPNRDSGWPRQVLRISRAGGAFGTRTGERVPVQPLGNVVEYPSASWLKDRRPYVEVRIERADGIWSVWFHGHHAGSVRDDGSLKTSTLSISAEGGPIAIDSVVLEPMQLRK